MRRASPATIKGKSLMSPGSSGGRRRRTVMEPVPLLRTGETDLFQCSDTALRENRRDRPILVLGHSLEGDLFSMLH